MGVVSFKEEHSDQGYSSFGITCKLATEQDAEDEEELVTLPQATESTTVFTNARCEGCQHSWTIVPFDVVSRNSGRGQQEGQDLWSHGCFDVCQIV